MIITNTEEVRLFRKVTVVEQDLVQQIVATVKEVFLADIRNSTTKTINYTVAEVIIHLQEKYSQLIPHGILKREDILNNMMYDPQYLIATVFYAVKELLDIVDITVTTYTQHQAVNISYTIIQRKVKFGLAIRKWDHMPTVQKTWVGFKQFF